MYKRYVTDGFILRIADGMIIPEDPLNRDYQDFVRYLESDGVLLLADEMKEEK